MCTSFEIKFSFSNVNFFSLQIYFFSVVRSFYRNNCQNFDFGKYEKVKLLICGHLSYRKVLSMVCDEIL